MKFFLTDTPSNLVSRTDSMDLWSNPTSYTCIVSGGHPAPDGSMSAYRLETNSSTIDTTGRGWRQSDVHSCFLGEEGDEVSIAVYLKKGSNPTADIAFGFSHVDSGWRTSRYLTYNFETNTTNSTREKSYPVGNGWIKLISYLVNTEPNDTNFFMALNPTQFNVNSCQYGSTYFWKPAACRGIYDELPCWTNVNTVTPLNAISNPYWVEIGKDSSVDIRDTINETAIVTLGSDVYHHLLGGNNKLSIKPTMVESNYACSINSWWGGGDQIKYQDAFAGNELNCLLVNKGIPMSQNTDFEHNYYRGILDLETYDGI